MGRRQKQRKSNKQPARPRVAPIPKPTPRLSVGAVAGLACASLVIAAVFVINRPARQHVANPVGAGTSLAHDKPRTSSITAVQITKPFDVSSVDVERQQWPTEVLNEKINDQLKALAEALSNTKQLNADALRPIVSDKVVAVDFKPTTAACFTDGNLRVLRVHPDDKQARDNLTGIDQLSVGFAAMLQPSESVTNVHVKFKIVQIETSNEIASTTVRVSRMVKRSIGNGSKTHCGIVTGSPRPTSLC